MYLIKKLAPGLALARHTARCFVLFGCGALLAACGAEAPPHQTPNSSSSSSSTSTSSTSSSSSSSSSGIAIVSGFCAIDQPANTSDKALMLISVREHRDRIRKLLNNAPKADGPLFATSANAAAPFEGRALFEPMHAEQRMAIAVELIYQGALEFATKNPLITCIDLSAQQCGEKFISAVMEPLLERPLNETETAAYLKFFTQANNPEEDGQRAALTAALSSPQFLFGKAKAQDSTDE